jgi:hypothetical protein
MIDSAFKNPEVLNEIEDLLAEVADKNHVVVVKYAAQEKRGKTIVKFEGDHVAQTVALTPALALQDKLRVMVGKKPLYLPEVYRRVGGELRDVSRNTRTNVGIDFVATQLASTAPTTQADYMALSNNTAAIAATDTSNVTPWSSNQTADAAAGATTGEMSYSGMARKQGTYAHTVSNTNYTLQATWTASGTVTAAQKAGNFGGSTRNTAQSATATDILFLANTFTATTLASSDQLSLTWTVNI